MDHATDQYDSDPESQPAPLSGSGEPERGITVAELRKALEGMPDGLEVILRISDEETEATHVCGLQSVTVCAGCIEVDALMLDGATYEASA